LLFRKIGVKKKKDENNAASDNPDPLMKMIKIKFTAWHEFEVELVVLAVELGVQLGLAGLENKVWKRSFEPVFVAFHHLAVRWVLGGESRVCPLGNVP
jgi:hypothetical protein